MRTSSGVLALYWTDLTVRTSGGVLGLYWTDLTVRTSSGVLVYLPVWLLL